MRQVESEKMRQTETVKVNKRFGDEWEGNYEFRQISQGEYEKILISYMDALGKVPKQDILKVNREMLWLSIVAVSLQANRSIATLVTGKYSIWTKHQASRRLRQSRTDWNRRSSFSASSPIRRKTASPQTHKVRSLRKIRLDRATV